MSDTGKTIALIKAVAEGIDPSAIEQSVSDWLDDHPEATTTVEDGSITKAKLDSNLQGTVDDVSTLKNEITPLARCSDTDAEDVDLDITDPSGNVIVRFADGHIQTKEFDSSELPDLLDEKQNVLTFDSAPTENSTNPVTSGGVYEAIQDVEFDTSEIPKNTNTDAQGVDLDITDPSGNVIARFADGHFKTKNFDSEDINYTQITDAQTPDLDLVDDYGNVILRLENGHVKTKKFDSSSIEVADPFKVPDYYHTKNYLNRKCDRVNQLARGCTKKMDTFAFLTDLHWHLNAGKSPALLRYIKENTRIDKFFCGGDIQDFIDSEHQPYDAWTQFQDAMQMPLYVAMGNHDYMSSYGTEGRLYYTFNSVGRDRIGNFDRNYFYIDNPQAQIRYIFLNGFQPNGSGSWTWGFEQTQLDWLTNTALDLDAGWGAIIVTHMTHSIDFSDGSVPKDSHALSMLSALDNYNGDGEIIAVISGHTHADYIDSTTGGIPIIVSTCDKYGPWISNQTNMEPWLSDRVEGTITEQAIDLFVVDREAKNITKVRVGCPIHYGTDPQTWTEYEEVTISYNRN